MSFFNRMRRRDPRRNETSSELEVDKNIISEFIVKKIIPIVGFSPFPLDELLLLAAAVCWAKPTHIFEWGTNVGKSARIFHEVCTEYGIDCRIHSIDLPDDVSHVEHPGRRRGEFVRGIGQVTLHQGDGLDLSLKLCREAGEGCRPLFFLDGDHSYESVKRELAAILTEVHSPLILVHDTFYQSDDSGYNIGPYRAIVDTCGGTAADRFDVAFTGLGLPGMCMIRRKA